MQSQGNCKVNSGVDPGGEGWGSVGCSHPPLATKKHENNQGKIETRKTDPVSLGVRMNTFS